MTPNSQAKSLPPLHHDPRCLKAPPKRKPSLLVVRIFFKNKISIFSKDVALWIFQISFPQCFHEKFNILHQIRIQFSREAPSASSPLAGQDLVICLREFGMTSQRPAVDFCADKNIEIPKLDSKFKN